MDFNFLPPEVNSGRMYAGPGSTPLRLAAGAWNALAAELESAAMNFSSVVSGLIGPVWSGPSSAAMQAASASYVGWLHGAAALCEQTAAQANSSAAAFEQAFAMTVPPAVVAANRALLTALVATNFLGQNSAAIAACEAQYAEMWCQDAAAMNVYACSAATTSTLTPFREPPSVADPAGLSAQCGAVAQANAGASGVHLLAQAAAAAPLGEATPSESIPLFGSTPLFSFSPLVSTSGLLPSVLGSNILNYPMQAISYGMILPSSQVAFGTKVAGVGADAARQAGEQARLAQQQAVGADARPPVSARLGRAGTVGPLSVPVTWASDAVVTTSAVSNLPITAVAGAPATVTPNSMFGQSLMSTLLPVRGDSARPRSKPVIVRNPASEHTGTADARS
ncbi:PPE family protein [[Mycobacterium] crassicus]|uniref:PPE family protein n=1 Tax=[Mycobacterium] crassicus TaxID=2872309 RepID=A0ABU5XPJ9_9MYCO|nr:PPE family protein [Mycolicibacter sp. MYC098]MEB3024190.1 PPE family protein [Mycolicibacter sp. MYC098]